jgi:hypothetical protein
MPKGVLFEQLIIILDNFRFKKHIYKSFFNWLHMTERKFFKPCTKKVSYFVVVK